MEVLFKILYFLCLTSAAMSSQLLPSLIVQSPIGIDLGIGGIDTNLISNINSKNNIATSQTKQCYCIPNNANSRPVTSHLEPTNEVIERIVVYLYKVNGEVKLYIPNRNKQELIPELNFDESNGDILKPVFSESIVDLFDPNIITPQQTVVTLTEGIVKETEMIDVETNKPEPINTISGSGELLIENIDYLSPITSNDNTLLGEDNPKNEENISIDNVMHHSSLIQGDEVNSPELNEIINLPNADQLAQITSALQAKPQEINSQITVIDSQDLEINPNLENSNQLNQITSMLPSNLYSSGSEDNDHKNNWDKIISLNDYDQLKEIFSLSPPKSQSRPELLLQQNPYSTESIDSRYITFYDWFEIQLKHVVLYNLETSSKIIEFRERVKKILRHNGMHINNNGVVTDSNGDLVQMNKIKLRPILIGGHNDPHNFFEQKINLPETRVSYVQLIEVILIAPPKLLGTLVMGTVFLPRNIHGGQKLDLWNSYKNQNIENKNAFGCTTCKSKNPQKPYSGSSSIINGPRNSAVTLPYRQYHGLPFRRTFNTGKNISLKDLPDKDIKIAVSTQQKQINEASRSSLGEVFNGLLGNFGITPTLITNPTRRLLGGAVPNGPKAGPKAYPNDVLPGFRIIGGAAATSSGTPLANKGRSGFEKPSYII